MQPPSDDSKGGARPGAWDELEKACDSQADPGGLDAAWGVLCASAVAPGPIEPNLWLDLVLNGGVCLLQPNGPVENLLAGLLSLHNAAVQAQQAQQGPFPVDWTEPKLRRWASGFAAASALDSVWMADKTCVRAIAPIVVAAGKLDHLPLRMREAMSHVFLSDPIGFLREAYHTLASHRLSPVREQA